MFWLILCFVIFCSEYSVIWFIKPILFNFWMCYDIEWMMVSKLIFFSLLCHFHRTNKKKTTTIQWIFLSFLSIVFQPFSHWPIIGFDIFFLSLINSIHSFFTILFFCFFFTFLQTETYGKTDYKLCVFKSNGISFAAYHIVLFSSSYLIPLVLISGLYICMCKRLWRTVASHNRTNESHRSRKRVTRLVFVVVAAFALLWLPIQVSLTKYSKSNWISYMKYLDVRVCVSLCLSNLLQTHSHIHNEFNCFLDEHRNYIISPISSYGREIKRFFFIYVYFTDNIAAKKPQAIQYMYSVWYSIANSITCVGLCNCLH